MESDGYTESIHRVSGTICLTLRAERSATGSARAYSVSVTATDGGGSHAPTSSRRACSRPAADPSDPALRPS